MGGAVVRTVKRRGAEERRGCESIHATHASFSSELVVGVDRWQPTLVGPVTLLLEARRAGTSAPVMVFDWQGASPCIG